MVTAAATILSLPVPHNSRRRKSDALQASQPRHLTT